MKKVTILILSLLLFHLVTQAKDKPNFLVILVDDMGYSDLGCYGGEIDTPNLDGLAANGLRFSQFYNTGRCWPSRASILTGYYAQQVRRDALPGIKGGGGRGVRPKWAPLVTEFLKKDGYRNYHSGKWHIDGKVLENDFHESWRVNNQGNFFSSKGNLLNDIPFQPEQEPKNYYSTTATASHAIKCLTEHSQDHTDKPFFHYLAFIAPHFPLHAPQKVIQKYKNRYLAGWDKMREQRFAKQKKIGLINTTLSKLEPEVGPPYSFPDAIQKLGPGEINRPVAWNQLSQEQKIFQATKMAIHAAMIEIVDQEIGRVLVQLKKMEAFKNTLILFASDNGASAEIMVRSGGHDPQAPLGSAKSYLCLGPGFSSAGNTPFRRHKTWVHEGGISTPLIAHWPKGIKAKGALRHSPSHVIDIVPTIMEMAGIQKPHSWKNQKVPTAPGKSLLPTFASEITIERDHLWWFHDGHRAVRQGDFKLVSAKNQSWELYDLKKDRAESKNLVQQKPELKRQLETIWNDQVEEFKALLIK
jgi:arylsulfatase A-like enzyme